MRWTMEPIFPMFLRQTKTKSRKVRGRPEQPAMRAASTIGSALPIGALMQVRVLRGSLLERA